MNWWLPYKDYSPIIIREVIRGTSKEAGAETTKGLPSISGPEGGGLVDGGGKEGGTLVEGGKGSVDKQAKGLKSQGLKFRGPGGGIFDFLCGLGIASRAMTTGPSWIEEGRMGERGPSEALLDTSGKLGSFIDSEGTNFGGETRSKEELEGGGANSFGVRFSIPDWSFEGKISEVVASGKLEVETISGITSSDCRYIFQAISAYMAKIITGSALWREPRVLDFNGDNFSISPLKLNDVR